MAYGPWWLASKANYASYRTAQFHNFLHFCPLKVVLFRRQILLMLRSFLQLNFEWQNGIWSMVAAKLIMRLTGLPNFIISYISVHRKWHFLAVKCVYLLGSLLQLHFEWQNGIWAMMATKPIMRIAETAQFHNFIHFSSLKVAHFSRQMCVFVEAISATFCIFSVYVANWGLYWGPVPAIVHHWVVCRHRLVI